MKNHQAEILPLRERIGSERKAAKNQNTSYSEEIKREVISLFHKLQSQSEVARKSGIPQTTISRWVRESTTRVVAPRRLVIIEPSKLEDVVAISQQFPVLDLVVGLGKEATLYYVYLYILNTQANCA